MAQRHSERSSPPTAQFVAPPAPIVAVSSGMGAIQFVAVNFGVPAPQALTRQLRFDDERTRSAALSAIGAPGQYLQHGHVPMPRAIDLQLAAIGTTDEMDALLTVELDQHLVTAVLVPVDGNWKRIATLIYAVPFEEGTASPTAWIRTERSLVQKDRYRAVFRATTGAPNGSFTENEAQLRIFGGKAVVTMSFESAERECSLPPTPAPTKAAAKANAQKYGCDVTERWFQVMPGDLRHYELVTGSGHITVREAEDPLEHTQPMMLSHLRNFSCQPFAYSEASQHFEPTAADGPCRK